VSFEAIFAFASEKTESPSERAFREVSGTGLESVTPKQIRPDSHHFN